MSKALITHQGRYPIASLGREASKKISGHRTTQAISRGNMGYHIQSADEVNQMFAEVGKYAVVALLDQEHAAFYCERIIISLGMDLSEVRRRGDIQPAAIPDDPVEL
jgi:hypothetical protein